MNPSDGTRQERPGRRRAAMFVLGIGIVVALSGCATMTGGAKGDIARSMSDVASATQSAVIAFDQYEGQRSTSPAVGTTLDDMLDEIETANTAVAELDVSTEDEAELRDEAAAAIRDCVDAVNGARASLAGLNPATPRTVLQDAADRATGLSDEWEQFK